MKDHPKLIEPDWLTRLRERAKDDLDLTRLLKAYDVVRPKPCSCDAPRFTRDLTRYGDYCKLCGRDAYRDNVNYYEPE